MSKSIDDPSFADEEKQARYAFGLNPPKSVISGHATRKASTQCAYMMPTFLSMAKENPKLKVLDVGCGPGSITVDFAEMIPQGHVIGYDLSGAVLETAKIHAESKGITNVEFVKGDVYNLPFEDGEFDVVHTHQAVAHFHENVRAIKELIRVTKKNGGILCMREGDLHTARFYPGYPELEKCFETIIKVHANNGGATDAGRRLKHWTVQAGIPRDRIIATHSAWSYNTPEGRKDYGGHWPGRCTHGAFAERARELGVTQKELDGYAMAWKKWTEDEDGAFAMMHGEVIARP
ncbi:putative methyltransferase C1B3.06c [Pseudocercospora fuligena]|uniref:Putative methyltransferase C1B3.06c n=1 Tax=Pseudocercospora fuligena TaxID=685502 RepID=A0A8H6RN36_9PEZI|nr:putative methyltransferase C1B3.06c [Pseudocercospora fuligena]